MDVGNLGPGKKRSHDNEPDPAPNGDPASCLAVTDNGVSEREQRHHQEGDSGDDVREAPFLLRIQWPVKGLRRQPSREYQDDEPGAYDSNPPERHRASQQHPTGPKSYGDTHRNTGPFWRSRSTGYR